jgi:hypothetical protein
MQRSKNLYVEISRIQYAVIIKLQLLELTDN